MLLTGRRTSLIHLCLTGMEVAWFVLFWSLIYRPAAAAPWLAYAGLAATLLAWVLALELLSRTAIESPAYDLIALGLMALTSLLAVRAVLYGGWPFFSLRWLGELSNDLFDFTEGFPPALALVIANLFLWQRATVATSRELSFFSVGLTFRLGMILIIVALGIWVFLWDRAPAGFLWLYFGLGLLAVGMARIHDKAEDVQSAGNPLSASRVLELAVTVGATLGVARLLAIAYTPAGVRAFLKSLDPLWQWIRPAVMLVLWLLAQLLDPVLRFLEGALRTLVQQVLSSGFPGALQTFLASLDAQRRSSQIPAWLLRVLLGVFLALIVIALAALIIGLLVLYLEKARRSASQQEGEEASREDLTFGGGLLGRGLAGLRQIAGLVRRYGLGRDLLAAISVQNMYANLCRLADRRGYGRKPAQPPDVYLPTLAQAFPDCDDALERITAAYMRVHYGDRPVTGDELVRIREDYLATRQAEPAGRLPTGA